MRPDRAAGTRSVLHPASRALRVLLVCMLAFAGACSRKSGGNEASAAPADLWKEFSGDKAFEHTKKLADFGPHPSGSKTLEGARQYIIDTLQAAGWQVESQKFTDNTPRGPVEFVNLIAHYGPNAAKPADSSAQIAIVASHYDTKLFDTIRFIGADDGCSSTGALLEMARVLALDPAFASKIELVFFDGEEAVEQFTETDGLYGSRYYARQLRESHRNAQFKTGVLWDMIGKKNLSITLSPDSPPDLAKGIFDASDALHLRNHFTYLDRDLLDDHVPLNEAHIPTIDLIDFDYIYWHTADDLLDKLSPDSLQTVGQVTLYYLRHKLAN